MIYIYIYIYIYMYIYIYLYMGQVRTQALEVPLGGAREVPHPRVPGRAQGHAAAAEQMDLQRPGRRIFDPGGHERHQVTSEPQSKRAFFRSHTGDASINQPHNNTVYS